MTYSYEYHGVQFELQFKVWVGYQAKEFCI